MATGTDMAQPVDRLDNGGTNGARDVRPRGRGKDVERPDDRGGTVPVVAPGDDSGMAVADSAARSQKWEPGDSVYLRLARAQADVRTLTEDANIEIKKDGKTLGKYKGVTSAQIVTSAKRALLDNGIVFVPVVSTDLVRVAGNKTAVYCQGQFISVDDSNDRFAAGAWGAGTDNNDKDFAKATTNAVKVLLSKVLMMSTLDDESDEATPHEPEHKPKAVKNAEALSDAAIKSWADAYKAALDGCRTLKDLKRVRAENVAMMNNPGVPAITKDYFSDKVAGLEGTLE